jgi:hypothetical protein
MLARVRKPSSPVRERKGERDKEVENEKEGERERDKEVVNEKEGERERERERCRICPDWLFLFLKGMTGALAPLVILLKNNVD